MHNYVLSNHKILGTIKFTEFTEKNRFLRMGCTRQRKEGKNYMKSQYKKSFDAVWVTDIASYNKRQPRVTSRGQSVASAS